ncbi:hypothetical protein BJV78DRAFT_1204706, partial [Lactifluus subvellereus]
MGYPYSQVSSSPLHETGNDADVLFFYSHKRCRRLLIPMYTIPMHRRRMSTPTATHTLTLIPIRTRTNIHTPITRLTPPICERRYHKHLQARV